MSKLEKIIWEKIYPIQILQLQIQKVGGAIVEKLQHNPLRNSLLSTYLWILIMDNFGQFGFTYNPERHHSR